MEFNAAKEELIFGIFTGLSKNKTEVLFQTDLRSHTFRYIGELSTTGIRGLLSPSGRFLAYSKWNSDGGCRAFANVGIIDLAQNAAKAAGVAGRVLLDGSELGGATGADAELRAFLPSRWRSDSLLEVSEAVLSPDPDNCMDTNRTMNYSLDVRRQPLRLVSRP